MKYMRLGFFAFLMAAQVQAGKGEGVFADAPLGVTPIYLTWQGDTSTTMTVNFLSEKPAHDAAVRYDSVSRAGVVADYPKTILGTVKKLPGVAGYMHRTTLTDLLPDTVYYFVTGDDVSGYSTERKFRTLPSGPRPLRLVQGGDNGGSQLQADLSKVAASYDPDVVLIGGDIAYDSGNYKNWVRWVNWFKAMEPLVTSDGRLIPMILAVGNHEIQAEAGTPEQRAPTYFGLFAQEKSKSFFTRRLGANAVVHALDTNHVTSHDSQKKWIEQQMKSFRKVPFNFALYHVPLYPSHRSYLDSGSVRGRNAWRAIFDKYDLDVAFENHDHSFKRSKPLKGGAVNSTGTIYVGDGCWGKTERDASDNRWYLEKSNGTPHVWVVDVGTERASFQAVTIGNRVIDSFSIKAED